MPVRYNYQDTKGQRPSGSGESMPAIYPPEYAATTGRARRLRMSRSRGLITGSTHPLSLASAIQRMIYECLSPDPPMILKAGGHSPRSGPRFAFQEAALTKRCVSLIGMNIC